MHINRYIFIPAVSDDAAKRCIERWLNDYAGREFYDGWRVLSAVPLSSLDDSFQDEEMEAALDNLRYWRGIADEAHAAGVRGREGHALKRAGDILCESLCEDMPWFNADSFDWTYPVDTENWYAVEVDFHY